MVAESGECLKIQAAERVLVPGRGFHPLNPEALARRALPASWFVGVLLCPGDSTEELARWAATLAPADLERIHFYVAPGVDLRGALSAWRRAALPALPINEVRDFRSFHHLYGRHHADRVYRDHAP